MKNPLLVPEFREMIARGNSEEIREFCRSIPPAILADFLGALSSKEVREILLMLTTESRLLIFSHFDDDIKLAILSLLDHGEVVELVARLPIEEAHKILKLLPADTLARIREEAGRTLAVDAWQLFELVEHVLKADEPGMSLPAFETIGTEIIPLMQVYRLREGRFLPAASVERECWINIVNPPPASLPLFARYFRIPEEFFAAAVDPDGIPRVETAETATLVIVRVPFFDEHGHDMLYCAFPIGIILAGGTVITVCGREQGLLRDFIEGRVGDAATLAGIRFALQIMQRGNALFLLYLRQMNNAAIIIQKKLEKDPRSDQLIKLMNIEKSLYYFVAALRGNLVMLGRLRRSPLFRDSTPDLAAYLDGIVTGERQALEMGVIYSKVLGGMMQVFGPVITSNLGGVLQFFTAVVTIALIPLLVAAIYGMNIELPLQDHPFVFVLVMLVNLSLTVWAVLYFIKKKWL